MRNITLEDDKINDLRSFIEEQMEKIKYINVTSVETFNEFARHGGYLLGIFTALCLVGLSYDFKDLESEFHDIVLKNLRE